MSIVLVVEDNPDHAELTVRALREHGIAEEIIVVSDGEQALDYLHRRNRFAAAESSPRPDLILLDLRLPKIDGLEVLNEIKRDPALQKCPVVVLTTSKASDDIRSAYHSFVNGYSVKPLDLEKYEILMRDLGAYWLEWNERVLVED